MGKLCNYTYAVKFVSLNVGKIMRETLFIQEFFKYSESQHFKSDVRNSLHVSRDRADSQCIAYTETHKTSSFYFPSHIRIVSCRGVL